LTSVIDEVGGGVGGARGGASDVASAAPEDGALTTAKV
jgi:hypothetical protein